MSTRTIDAQLLADLFLTGAAKLQSQKEYINELNVFPVPDGDTGTNMTMTIMSAASAVTALEDVNMKTLSKAISNGSLRGARGNSGVILSQLLRGFCKTIQDVEELDLNVTAEAFQRAVETAYKAVMKPKEGTILTVAKESALEAARAAEECEDFETFMERILKVAKTTLEHTPELLPVLKEAGVVDSGGTGLYMVFLGVYDALTGKETDYEAVTPEVTQVRPVKVTAQTEAEITFGYCTEFIIVLNRPLNDDELDDMKKFLDGMGDSIVFVPDDEIIKIHVHTNNPGTVLQKALTHGSLSRIKIDNMREEHQEILFKNAPNAGGVAVKNSAAEAPAPEEAPGSKAPEEAPKEHKKYGFVAVTAGDGLHDIFVDLGADEIISGGQTMNPSTDDILQAVEKINADVVFVLPNNKNIILAANQVADLVTDKQVIVVPSKTIPQGITAMISFVEEEDAQANAELMAEALSAVKTGELTYAIRDTSIEGTQVHEGDYMGIGDAGLLSVGTDIAEVLTGMIAAMVDEDAEIITLYYGADTSEETAGAVCETIRGTYPDCDVDLLPGGQPVYYFIASVE